MDKYKPKNVQVGGQSKEGVGLDAATIHELKTSLTAIIASAELLVDEIETGEESTLRRLIQGIIRNARGMDEKLTYLSEMDRLRAGDIRSELETVEVKSVIRDVAAQFSPITQSKKQSLTVELPDSIPPVKVNRRYMEQILSTLLANASKFTPDQGKLKVKAWQDNDYLAVQVDDTGVGIPIGEQEKIFQPRYQVSHGKEESRTGSGLGLAIAKHLVELHGGRIWLKSVVGRGSSFFFTLPLESSASRRS